MNLFRKIIGSVLTFINKALKILADVINVVFYKVTIALTFLFILPCLLLGLVLTFKYHQLIEGLLSFLSTFLLVKINKSMQGGN